jgi:hypothetical protein
MDLKSFNTKNKILTPTMSLDEVYGDFKQEIYAKASNMQEKDSGKFTI